MDNSHSPHDEPEGSDAKPAAEFGDDGHVHDEGLQLSKPVDALPAMPAPATPETIKPPEPSEPTPMPTPLMATAPPAQTFAPETGVQSPFAQPVSAAVAPPNSNVDAGLVILQWLTYAFWGWTILALSVLTTMVLANFIADAENGSFTPYGIAAVLVLLPISFICDTVYAKREPIKKTGPETLVMVIHAVIFALFGIGSLIVAVISLVMLFTSAGDSSSVQVALWSALVIAVFYGLVFIRTLNPLRFPWIKKYFKLLMIITVGVFGLLGIIGPVAKERSLRNDKLLESNLSNISYAISSYASKNKKLPATLDDLNLKNDAKLIVDKKLVTYKPGFTVLTSSGSSVTAISTTRNSTTQYKYQLCATFTHESNSKYRTYDDYSANDDGYSTYLSAYYHDKGEVCYKLETSGY